MQAVLSYLLNVMRRRRPRFRNEALAKFYAMCVVFGGEAMESLEVRCLQSQSWDNAKPVNRFWVILPLKGYCLTTYITAQVEYQ